jgi:hypothetical protein
MRSLLNVPLTYDLVHIYFFDFFEFLKFGGWGAN